MAKETVIGYLTHLGSENKYVMLLVIKIKYTSKKPLTSEVNLTNICLLAKWKTTRKTRGLVFEDYGQGLGDSS